MVMMMAIVLRVSLMGFLFWDYSFKRLNNSSIKSLSLKLAIIPTINKNILPVGLTMSNVYSWFEINGSF